MRGATIQMLDQGEKVAARARSRAEEEAGRIREKAEPRMDRAVDFILSRVVP